MDLEKSIRQLIDDGLEDSADKLCSLLISSFSHDSTLSLSSLSSSNTKFQSFSSSLSLSLLYELQGDCAYIKGEYCRSHVLYRQALTGSQVKKFYTIDSFEMANIHYKASQCLLKTGDKTAAIRELEIIPKEFRTTKINICLGKLYHSTELRLSAIGVLKQALKNSPLAIECMEMLVQLGVELNEIFPPQQQMEQNNDVTFSTELIQPIITSLSSQHRTQFQEARSMLETSLQLFPKCPYLHHQAALCSYESERIEECISHFRQIRLHDSKQIKGMDKFALLLYSQCINLSPSSENHFLALPRRNGINPSLGPLGQDITGYREELCRLASDLLNDYPKNPISWSCAALYTDLKGDKEKALLFIDKSCTKLEPRLAASFNIKGMIHLTREQPDQAAISFSQANSLEKNVDSYLGLAESNFQLGKSVEVLDNVKIALKLRPNSSRCFTLIGRALAKAGSINSKKDAIKGYRKAIRLNSANIYPVLELSDILCTDEQYEEAAEILRISLETNSAYLLHCYYGKVLGKLRQYDKAIQQLHFAMSSCPQGSDVTLAIQEVDQIEALLQGQDLSYSNDYYDHSLKSVESPLS